MDARMKTIGTALVLGLVGVALARPIAVPFPGEAPAQSAVKGTSVPTVDAFGDPGDFGAAAAAATDYLVAMQADITEDNAGNGDDGVDESPDDPDDGGWDWVTTTFSHGTAVSPGNLYGVTANGLYRNYLVDPQSSWFTAMQDAADEMVARGPAAAYPVGVRSGPDVTFLLDFASLPGVVDPSVYEDGAVAIWDYQMAAHGGPQGLAEYIRDARAVSYPNGIIPWDVAPWVKAAMALYDYDSMGGYDLAAAQMAEVLYQDSYGGSGYFEPFGHSQGFDPTYGNADYWYYTLGVTGLIDAFCASGEHTGEIAALEGLLLDCQYASGAFSYSYGAEVDDEDWQSSAYCLSTIGSCLPGNDDALGAGALWLAATQDASGGFVYGSGNHYPEIAAECAAGLSYSTPYTVVQSPLYTHIAENDGAPYVDTATLHYELVGGAEEYRAVTVFIQYDAAVLTPTAIQQTLPAPANTTFQFNLGVNPIEVSLAILGVGPGLSGALDLFDLEFDGNEIAPDEVSTLVEISTVVMRDLANQPIYAEAGDAATIVVDDLEPTLVPVYAGSPCVDGDFDVELTAGDNVDLDRVEYSIDGGAWTDTGLAFDGVGPVVLNFTVPTGLLSDGDHDVDFLVWDAVGYSYSPAEIEFHLDTVDPVAATDLEAMPNDHQVDLTWTDDGASMDSVQIWRAKRPVAYPYVLGVPAAAAWPADYVWIASVLGGVQSYPDDFGTDLAATRGVYDYVLVSKDCVNAPAASLPASATNYFLGDWATTGPLYGSYDGFVCLFDLQILGDEYGNAADVANDELDVAPTHDYSRFGLPGPDDLINFEDLIVLAMNYRACGVSPLNALPAPLRGKDAVVDAASSLELAGEGAVRQLLLDGTLLGLTAEIATDARLVSATSSQGMAMFYATDAGWQVDVVGLADLLDADTVVELRFAGEADVALVAAEGRDESNRSVELTPVGDVALAQPTSFGLAQNHPNPFNPSTTIRYSLAVDGPARLSVYNALGQQVRVLVDGAQAAGEHDVRFDAGQLASGLYIYRLEAGEFVAQQKMVLVK